MMSRKSSILSGLISASTHTTNGLALRAEEEDMLILVFLSAGLGEKDVVKMGRDNARMKIAMVLRWLKDLNIVLFYYDENTVLLSFRSTKGSVPYHLLLLVSFASRQFVGRRDNS